MRFDYEIYDPAIARTLAFRQVQEGDGPLVHKWMNEDHVHPYWQLNLPWPAFHTHFQKAVNDPHQTLYIGCIHGMAMSYWEAYWVRGDVIEDFYHPHPFDQGIHLLIGEKDFLGRGYALPLLKAMVQFQFRHEDTSKVVAEPDIRNEKMIHVFQACGFRPVGPITLPDKEALLMFCEREEFERRWKDEAFIRI
ncbi:acetyltransferase [Halobacillus kuroshimensis]|uniref:Lysine N-acyltransferase MbtK n=1 Tax=Halobacillus kuroshimensis TaxID=302481 RepID=A0ABS3DR29_9BACI|nr:GNAT family N-acetyltransferase [Halobacillus kuroshimensis]MBN8233785.1 acetyltransferase [Halobacillus kuroshimensis]